MGITKKSIWKAVIRASETRKLILVLLPLFVRPKHFLDKKDKPAYVRLLRSLWTTPMIAAVLVRSGVEDVFKLFGLQNFHHSNWSAFEINLKVEEIAGMIGWGMFATCLILIYGLAAAQWSFHVGFAIIFRRYGRNILDIPFSFFVATKATIGLWVGLLLQIMAWIYRKSHGNVFEYISQQIKLFTESHPYVLFVIMLGVVAFSHFSTKNKVDGMREIYDGSNGLFLLSNTCSIALLLMAGWSIHYFMK